MNAAELHRYLLKNPGATVKKIGGNRTLIQKQLKQAVAKGYATRKGRGTNAHPYKYFAAIEPPKSQDPTRITEADLERMRQHSPELERLVRAELERMRA